MVLGAVICYSRSMRCSLCLSTAMGRCRSTGMSKMICGNVRNNILLASGSTNNNEISYQPGHLTRVTARLEVLKRDVDFGGECLPGAVDFGRRREGALPSNASGL